MFTIGFTKIALMKSNITPEEYYDLKNEKDPYVGALVGATIGAGLGAYKARKQNAYKGAVIGAAIGAPAGASANYLAGKAGKALRLNMLRSQVHHLKLKTAPSRSDYQTSEGEH